MGDHFFGYGWIEVCLVILAVNKIVYGHRMLDIDVDSIMSQLKNKVSYRLEQALKGVANDPEANEYAKEKEELKASHKKLQDDMVFNTHLNKISGLSNRITKINF